MDRWYWIELIGFDNEAADYGVGAFLDRCVSADCVSLLFSHIDFLFCDKEQLPVTACSYFGHEYSKERRRQSWTRTQLRGLIDELHRRGVKVFFSSFDMTKDITDPSMLCFNSLGTPERLVYVIKRAKDGRLVGEEIIERISRILIEFNFDGLHLADGLSSNRLSIENGDFSLSFCREFPQAIPRPLMNEGEDFYVRRRRWILENKKFQWIQFIADRWAEFYDKLYKAIDKPIIFNNAWTRDTFEALYRYGIDYSRCGIHQAYGVMIEENSASRAIMAPEDEAGVIHTDEERDSFTYEYTLMQQNIRLVTKGLRQISLCPISDTMEQWDAIRHCPTELSRSIVQRYNSYVYRDGGFEACSDSPLYCLSDGIARSDWEWLSVQESYRLPTPQFINGFAAICNPKATRREVELYCTKKHYFGSALLRELRAAGMSIGVMVDIDAALEFKKAKCLVVTDLQAYSNEDRELLSRVSLPLLIIGEDIELNKKPSAIYRGKYTSVAIYNFDENISFGTLSAYDRTVRKVKTAHGEIWTESLSYKRMCPEFFEELSELLTEAFAVPKSLNAGVKAVVTEADGSAYAVLSNDSYTYTLATVNMRKNIKNATAIMKYIGYRVKLNGTSFTVRIPPRGVEIVRMEL